MKNFHVDFLHIFIFALCEMYWSVLLFWRHNVSGNFCSNTITTSLLLLAGCWRDNFWWCLVCCHTPSAQRVTLFRDAKMCQKVQTLDSTFLQSKGNHFRPSRNKNKWRKVNLWKSAAKGMDVTILLSFVSEVHFYRTLKFYKTCEKASFSGLAFYFIFLYNTLFLEQGFVQGIAHKQVEYWRESH